LHSMQSLRLLFNSASRTAASCPTLQSWPRRTATRLYAAPEPGSQPVMACRTDAN
jgi:hypothetical protein